MNDVDWLTPEIALLIERSAELRRGLAFVSRAPVESVAVTLGVHPRTVDHARDCLATPEMRSGMIREFQRAVVRRASRPPPCSRPLAGALPEPTREEPDVLREAMTHPYGLEFVMRAPLESVAISFGVHPADVAKMRDELARRTA
jgi:Tat protein secretion system quality control protein TatD with DNase activity